MDTSVSFRTVNGETPMALSMIATRRLIRHRVTELYFGRQGWTSKIEEAVAFQDAVEAAQACINNNLWEVDLVLQPGSAGADLFLTPMR